MKQLMLGNAAVARGLYEAGCCVISSYPGTPSTEITEEAAKYDAIYCEWAPNEKVAMEVAFGAALAGKRSACVMKHVGVNVAADPLFTMSYTGVNGGMIIGVAGGYVVSILTGAVNPDSYIIGIQYDFKPFYITYSLIKSSTFAFIITSISGFYGYYADGNSLEVGRASTKAVVVSSIVILIFNLILTQVLLT